MQADPWLILSIIDHIVVTVGVAISLGLHLGRLLRDRHLDDG